MISDQRRRQHLKNGKMRVLRKNVDSLVSLFADKSYALTQEGDFVPIVARHMTIENWRELFWLQPKKLVINGQVHKSLCSVCTSALDCLSRKEQPEFECTAQPKTLIVDMRRRR